MKVNETKEIRGPDKTPPPAERGAPAQRADRVSVEATRAAEAVNAVHLQAGSQRTARLKQLETAIRSGNFRPNASQLADQLLAAAELDARLRAMMHR